MALRNLLTKVPAFGLRPPSPAATSRYMSSHARTGCIDPKKLLELDPNNKLAELDQVLAEGREADRAMLAFMRSEGAKWDKLTNVVLCSFEAFVAFHVLQHLSRL